MKSIRADHPMFFQINFLPNNKLIIVIFKHESLTKFHEGHGVQICFFCSDELIASDHKKFLVTS